MSLASLVSLVSFPSLAAFELELSFASCAVPTLDAAEAAEDAEELDALLGLELLVSEDAATLLVGDAGDAEEAEVAEVEGAFVEIITSLGSLLEFLLCASAASPFCCDALKDCEVLLAALFAPCAGNEFELTGATGVVMALIEDEKLCGAGLLEELVAEDPAATPATRPAVPASPATPAVAPVLEETVSFDFSPESESLSELVVDLPDDVLAEPLEFALALEALTGAGGSVDLTLSLSAMTI